MQDHLTTFRRQKNALDEAMNSPLGGLNKNCTITQSPASGPADEFKLRLDSPQWT